MGLYTPTLSPWCYLQLGGVQAAGTIIKGGIKGFKRETGFDKKRGKGAKGASLTLTTLPPTDGEVTLQLFTSADFDLYDSFVEQVLSVGAITFTNAAGLVTDAWQVYHPSFSSIGLTKVVVEWYTPPEPHSCGYYRYTIKLLEWQQPPPVSIVKQVTKAAVDLPGAGAGFLPDSARNVQDRAYVARLQGGAAVGTRGTTGQ